MPPVIEILVKPGQSVVAEQSLLTLESDKASMEVPCPKLWGWYLTSKVKLGDKVSTGSLILTLTAGLLPAPVVDKVIAESASTEPTHPSANVEASASAPSALDQADCDLLVLGAGQVATAPRFVRPTWG